jgi:ATP-dependent exoDNAse (exonuclease V) beta subunit
LPQEFVDEADNLRLMPLFELLEKLFGIFQLSHIEKQDAYLFSFFDAVNEYLQNNSSELTAFLTYWEEKLCYKTIPSGEIEGIRILSIHKSKGLEFHTVLLPFCDWKLENERASYIWCSPQEAPFNELQLLPISYGTSMNESIYHSDYLKEKLQLWVDSLNLLYVAFTRPKCNLVVWCKDGQKNTVAELLASSLVHTSCEAQESIDDCIYQFGELCPSEEKKSKSVSSNKLTIKPQSVPVWMESLETNIEFKQSNRSTAFIEGEEDEGKKYIREGQLLHNLFAMVRTPEDVPSAINRLRMEGVIESKEHEEKVLKLANWALGHPKVKEWFSGEWSLYNECAIIYKVNGELQTRRPDRVMMKDDEVIVVDFKFGKPYPEYNEQVREYMNLLQSMGYKRVSGYLWYVFYNILEEIE